MIMVDKGRVREKGKSKKKEEKKDVQGESLRTEGNQKPPLLVTLEGGASVMNRAET